MSLSYGERSVLIALIAASAAAHVSARVPAHAPAQPVLPLEAFLRTYLRDSAAGPDTTTRYAAARARLSADGGEAVVVYLMGRSWCGSGGCTTLILARDSASYREVGRVPVSLLPVRVLASTTRGWHDLGVRARGVRAAGRQAVIRYDGRRYTGNPSTAPLAHAGGRVVLPMSAEEVPLYRGAR